MTRSRRAAISSLPAALACLCTLALPGAADAARGLRTGLAGPEFDNADAQVRNLWQSRAAAAGASIVRINVVWDSLVSGKPEMPRNPADPAYSFTALDRAVITARSKGLAPMPTIYGPPSWAVGSGCSSAGSVCLPDPKAFGDLGVALARRYSGSFGILPRVKHYQAWVEPNLEQYLAPQWRDGKAIAPSHYRKMLNAFYAGVRSVHRSNFVITGGTAPFGDPKGGGRMRPVEFWRHVLCLNPKLKKECSAKARFDAIAHHAINPGGGPTVHAINRDDAAVPDLGRIKRVLRAAERRGTAPGGRHVIWMTETWWESDPPDGSYGVGLRKQAARIVRTMYEVWRDGASVAINLLIRDAPHDRSSPASSLQSGLYFRSGKAKPALRAFRFPFLARRHSRGRILVWGVSPAGGRVQIQRRKARSWRNVATRKAGRGDVFRARIRTKGKAEWRAKAGAAKSLSSQTG